MALINSDVVPFTGGAYEIEQSLRFNNDDSAYLEWTPSAEGNRRTWTLSLWFKGYWDGGNNRIFGSHVDANNLFGCFINSSGQLSVWSNISAATSLRWYSNALLRDPSAWYHLVFVLDTTQATSTNRFKVYLNGEQLTTSSYTAPSQNAQERWNSTTAMWIGKSQYAGNLDGYLAEVNFIDGQALDASYFGKTGTYGEWKPIEYTGTYGTNGFYLPFKQDYQVEGFSTTLYTGTGSSQYIGGVGFSPDFVWLKSRNSANHALFDTIRGVNERLQSNTTSAESTRSDALNSFDSDGFTVGAETSTGATGVPFVAWCWDMGGSNVSNTDGSITSTVRANPTYGQSIVSYAGDNTASATVGHGLSSAPEIVIVKNRTESTPNWETFVKNISGVSDGKLRLNTTDTLNTTYPLGTTNSTIFTLPNVNSDAWSFSGDDFIAYCFHSVSGYSKIGSYTGNGSTSNTITTGFKPAFVMIKNTDQTTSWVIADNMRDSNGTPHSPDKYLHPNTSDAEGQAQWIDFLDTGFKIKLSNTTWNGNGDTLIYMAFADTREFAYWLDQSGNNNDWLPTNLTESDISVDSPTNNFATANPLASHDSVFTYYEGNLKINTGGTGDNVSFSTIPIPKSGKWYYEQWASYGSTPTNSMYYGIADTVTTTPSGWSIGCAVWGGNGQKRVDGSWSAYTSGWGIDNIIGVAIDVDGGAVEFYKNGTSLGSISYTFNANATYGAVIRDGGSDNFTTHLNFGQDSSFAGNKTAQGNTDDNSIGDFYYTPPSGYLALCTANLPDPAVIPSEHFNTVLYTGNGSTQSITGVGFQPDWVWIKQRDATANHKITDAVRGATKELSSNLTSAEGTSSSGLTSFNTDGFTLGNNPNGYNGSGETHVAWNWKANGSGSSNTSGSITSTVSANQDAGFSIVSYTGNGTSGSTVGHGLSSTPELLITGRRNASADWMVWTTGFASNEGLNLNYVDAKFTSGSNTFNFDVNSSTFDVGTSSIVNTNGGTYITYAFHSVDGYSKVGTYTGNNSADGTFVYTGFRTAFVMLKKTNSTGNFCMHDTVRSPDNPAPERLFANTNSSEGTSAEIIDLLSNGFKLRIVGDAYNTIHDFVYIAFAENPFKYTNAR